LAHPLAVGELRFGLDFGTSNSAVAVFDGTGVRLLPIDPIVGDTLPSVLYVRRDGSAHIGHPAIQSFLADNRARGPVRREYKPLGIRMVSSNPRQATGVDVIVLSDTSSPGRFFQSLKTFLGDPLLSRTNVFGDERGLEDLIAMILSGIFQRVEELPGPRPTSATHTFAPSAEKRIAASCPMPPAAPVMTATLPSSRPVCVTPRSR